MKKKTRKLLSFILAAAMLVIAVQPIAFAQDAPEYLPETEIDESIVTDGMFYLASGGAELYESSGHGYLLKIARRGDASDAAKVRLTMLGQTASYGKDYTVSLFDAGLFEGKVENARQSKSMLDVMLENEDAIEEYNYSDAIVDGSIDPNAEVQLTDEQMAEIGNEAQNIAEALLESEMDAIAETAPESYLSDAQDESGDVTDADAPSEDAVDDANGADTADDASVSDVRETSEPVVVSAPDGEVTTGSMSLLEAKANATGLESDKTPMSGGDAKLNAPYLTNRQEELDEALQSAYLVIDFAEGETEKYIEITPKNNYDSDGDRRAFLKLSAEENALVSEGYSGFTLNIIDDEEYVPSTVQFSAAEYHPEDGFITVYVERTGDISNVFELYIDTEDITAVKGDNYSEVHSKLQFPFGLKERHVNIPVRSDGLTEPVSFKIKLSSPSGCVIGDQSEAVGIIAPGDKSFDSSSLPEDEASATLQAAYSTSSVEVGPAMDLSACAKDQRIASGHSKWVNDHWEIETTGSMYDSYTNWQYFNYFNAGNKRGISGWQIDWSLSSSKPCWAYTWVYNWNGDDWKEIASIDDDRWGRTTSTYFVNDKFAGYVGFELRRSGAFLARSPKLNLYSIKPVLRPFEVSLMGAEPVQFINENGERVSATAINEYKNKCDTVLENASNTGTGTLVTHTGEMITVSLKNIEAHPLVRISGINLISPDGAKWRISGVKSNGTSASFELTEDFLRGYDSYIRYIKNGDHGLKGAFTVQPILSNIDATVTVTKDARADITAKAPFSDNTSGKYNLHLGDYISIGAKITPDYTNQYIWKGFNNSDTGITYNRKGDAEYVSMSITDANTTLAPVFSEREDMRLIVRVPTANLKDFDTAQGVFTCPSEVNGQYTDYIIATSDDGTFDLNKYYTLSAKTNNQKYVPVWKPVFSKVSYSQNDFPFESRALKSENVVYLEAKSAVSTPYVLSGTVYCEYSLNSNDAVNTAWYPAKNTFVVVDSLHYGITDDNGSLTTMPFYAADSTCVRIALRGGGNTEYKDISLSTSGTSQINIGKTVLRTKDLGGPYVESVVNCDVNQVYSSRILIADDIAYWTATINYRGYDPAQGVPYIDSDGKTRYEKVESLEFIVIDPTTHSEKYVVEGKQDKNDASVWTASAALAKGRRNQYSDSDLLYVRITTDRVIGNGTAEEPVLDANGNITGFNTVTPDTLQHTIYAPLNTGKYFVEENPQETPDYNITPTMDGADFKLPIIGSLLTNINIKGFNLSIEEIPGGMRLGFGALLKKWGNIYDGSGQKTADTGKVYDLTN
ncbi:MAG: hypothetical protein IIZ19_03570, partial [Clostridia bacterium]|nr:hypothetical protein [Clostridia bacterium]